MRTLPILEELPPGFCVEEAPRGILAISVDTAVPFFELGYGPEHDGPRKQSDLDGRIPLGEYRLGEERFLVRDFCHGGLLRWLTGRRFLDPERPFRELILSHALNRLDLRTPQVVSARAQRPAGWKRLLPGWYLEVITRRVEGSIDLGRVLGQVVRGERERDVLSRLLPTAGRLVRALHKQGVLHADLTPRNVLATEASLQEGEPELWVIDLDRSQRLPDLSDSVRRNNLRRLIRHIERTGYGRDSAASSLPSKKNNRRRGLLSRTEILRFLRAYHAGRKGAAGLERDKQLELRARWKADWRNIARDRSRGVLLHRLGWWLENRFGRRSTLPAAESNLAQY